MKKPNDFINYHKNQQNKIEHDFLGKTHSSTTDLIHSVTTNGAKSPLRKKK